MGEQLNIKDAETIDLARDLARQLGKSVTATIREALEDKARARADQRQAKINAINAVVDAFQQKMPDEWRGKTSAEIMDEIYDEHGLPK